MTVPITMLTLLGLGQMEPAQSRPLRLEIASGFHPADPQFGKQLQKVLVLIKANKADAMKLRASRKTRGASVKQMVDLIGKQSIDGALVDPIHFGYRPAIAQIFGGIPFGPGPAKILAWSRSPEGSKQIASDFAAIGLHALVCGHRESVSGVFAKEKIEWPVPGRKLTIHSRGLADEVYQGLGVPVRRLHGADQYMGFATGVVDLMVSLNPSFDARAGYAQVSRYFYYPSWERRSAFAFLVIGQRQWKSLSVGNREAVSTACEALNSAPLNTDVSGTLTKIASQGAENTIVEPWPGQFLEAARAAWVKTAAQMLDRHPSLAAPFTALGIPEGAKTNRR